MKTFNYTITDPEGIHARPAGLLTKAAKDFTSKITITKDGKAADAKKIFALMSLGCKQGNEITVEIEGEDEETAAVSIQKILKENL